MFWVRFCWRPHTAWLCICGHLWWRMRARLHRFLPSICSNKQAIYLVEASMEDPLDLIIFKCGSLDLSCCILIIKRHSLGGCWANRNRKAETNINWVKYPTSHHKLEQTNILCSKRMIGLKEMLWTRPNQITGTGRKKPWGAFYYFFKAKCRSQICYLSISFVSQMFLLKFFSRNKSKLSKSLEKWMWTVYRTQK